jgi:hypothetical protein
MRQVFILFFILLLTNNLFGQNFQVPPNYSFTSKNDYTKYEKDVIQAVDWLEKTPLNQETDKRKQVNIFIFKYIEGSPTVSVTLQGYVAELTKKNPELLIAFLGGWAKYQLEHPTINDQVRLNAEGVKTVLRVYKLGGAAKDKNIEKLLKFTTDPELESWVKSKLS